LCLAALLVLALVAGAGRSKASTSSGCVQPAPSGRQFCVTIVDQDGVSPSGVVGSGNRQANVTAYQYYKFTIQNVGGSTLTQGTGSFTLTDHVVTQAGTSDVNSSAVYVPDASAPFCSVTSTTPNAVSCTFQNQAAGSDPLVFYLVYRTSTTANVTRTDLSGSVTFKESTTNGANPSSLPICNDPDPTKCAMSAQTSLEPDPESSVTWSPTNSNVQMGTSPTADTQWSVLQYKVPPGKASFLANMGEGADNLCPSALAQGLVKKCFPGVEKVTTVLSAAASGTFSADNPFHLTINVDQNVVSGGNIKLIHLPDPPATVPEIISTQCAHTPPLPSDTLPCITVGKDTNAHLTIINAYGFQNGGWVPGI
jgi:hypothetical protein